MNAPEPIRHYASRIARNVAKEIRDTQAECEILDEAAPPEEYTDDAPSLEDTCDFPRALAGEIRKFDQLPGPIKLVFRAYARHESIESIAQQLNVSERTVYRHLNRAKEEFGHLLDYLRGDRNE